MPLTWEQSGQGPEACPIALQDAQQLCVEAGFTYRGADDGSLPLARRADLQAMFEHFGVNSLSAFRSKFWARQLRPGGPGSGEAEPPGPPGPPAARSRWAVQQAGEETYVGETLNGLRHGGGILLTKGPRSWVLHVGRFDAGQPSGPGVVATSRGEAFEGYWMEGLMWGPGEYRFATQAPPPSAGPKGAAGAGGDASAEAGGEGAGDAAPQQPRQASEQPQQQQEQQEQEPQQAEAHRVRFRGMMNGRPAGKGCLEWSDGRRQAGQFDGTNRYMGLSDDAVAGTLLVAADNAADARATAADVRAAAAAQVPSIASEAARLLAAVHPAPAQHAAKG